MFCIVCVVYKICEVCTTMWLFCPSQSSIGGGLSFSMVWTVQDMCILLLIFKLALVKWFMGTSGL